MKKDWDIEELEASFALLLVELVWLDNDANPHNRLGQAILLKYAQYQGRFPESRRDVSLAVAEFIAHQIDVEVSHVDQYQWNGRTARRHRRAARKENVELRQQVHSATTVVERYNDFLDWLSFGGDGVIRIDDPGEQEKRIKCLNLVANAVLLHSVVDMTDALGQMSDEGIAVTRGLTAKISPYMTGHIKRFGEYFVDMQDAPPPLQPDKEFLSEPI